MPRNGRPPSKNPRNIRLEIRLTVEENSILEQYAALYNLTKTQVIVKGLRRLNEADRTVSG
jgi:uncharacterized protein (DUF1778 family)